MKKNTHWSIDSKEMYVFARDGKRGYERYDVKWFDGVITSRCPNCWKRCMHTGLINEYHRFPIRHWRKISRELIKILNDSCFDMLEFDQKSI